MWESGQDVSSRFGPQQTGGTIIQHVRPVDLQASMAQSAAILALWADVLSQKDPSAPALDFVAEAATWRKIAAEFTIKTRLMWQDGWFRDYDSVAQEWSSQQDTMHLAPLFCGVAGREHTEQLRTMFSRPPMHSGWAPLSWPPVVMTLLGAAEAAEMFSEAAELAYRFINASYQSIDSRSLDEHGGLPGVTREYRQPAASGKHNEIEYVNAGIEGYGWGALSIHLLLRYILGLREEENKKISLQPFLPQTFRRPGATYRIEPIQWGSYALGIECLIKDPEHYTLRISCRQQEKQDPLAVLDDIQEKVPQPLIVSTYAWEGTWGQKRTLQLPHLTEYS